MWCTKLDLIIQEDYHALKEALLLAFPFKFDITEFISQTKQCDTDTIESLISKFNKKKSVAALKELTEHQIVDIIIQGLLPNTRILVIQQAPKTLDDLKGPFVNF